MTTGSSVLLVTPRWARDGGVGAHVEASAALLASNGVRVRILAARIELGESVPGIEICHSPRLFKAEATIEQRLAGALDPVPEVVHMHQVDDPELARRASQVAPVVVSAHAYTACSSGVHYFRPGHECHRAHGPGCVPNLLLRGCAHTRSPRSFPGKYRYATRGVETLRQADLAVSYSTAVDRHLAENGITRRTIVPYFPTMPAARDDEPEPDRRRVVFAGRVVAPKGVDVLIRAAKEVEGEFVVCGDGRRLAAARRLAQRLGVEDRVRFTGWLDGPSLAAELAAASVVAVPSVWPEPFGIVGIEGFAAGRPAVASATGGITDWLDDGVSGLCVPPAKPRLLAAALNELLADPERRRAMGEAGRASLAGRFSGDRHLEVLLAGYRSARESWEARTGAAPVAPVASV
jgi:glycosyltransferase involved in cell wall biosynthesis